MIAPLDFEPSVLQQHKALTCDSIAMLLARACLADCRFASARGHRKVVRHHPNGDSFSTIGATCSSRFHETIKDTLDFSAARRQVIDATKDDSQKEMLTKDSSFQKFEQGHGKCDSTVQELENVGIRLNRKPPDVTVRPTKGGGLYSNLFSCSGFALSAAQV